MPLLLNVLWNPDGPDYRKLRVKAMDCAGLICASRVVFVLSSIDRSYPHYCPSQSPTRGVIRIDRHMYVRLEFTLEC